MKIEAMTVKNRCDAMTVNVPTATPKFDPWNRWFLDNQKLEKDEDFTIVLVLLQLDYAPKLIESRWKSKKWRSIVNAIQDSTCTSTLHTTLAPAISVRHLPLVGAQFWLHRWIPRTRISLNLYSPLFSLFLCDRKERKGKDARFSKPWPSIQSIQLDAFSKCAWSIVPHRTEAQACWLQ